MLSMFQVSLDGETVNGRLGGKARHLLKILAANRQKCLPRDLIIDMMWPDSDPDSAGTSLKVTAHNLRSALEPERGNGSPSRWVIAESGTYRLNPDADIRIDVEEFRDLCGLGRALETSGDLAGARRTLDRAESLYTGDYLEEDIYEDWTIVVREELRDLYLYVLGRLSELALREGAHEEVIRYCHKIISADPCREDAYRLLMRSHGALNQIARAGAWYAVCRSVLQREVGVPLSTETVEEFERLFQGRSESNGSSRSLLAPASSTALP
jgi:LuxR family maltose regulon positive regulatory protein